MTQITHVLKIEDNFLKRLLDGSKTHEVRFNDRDFQVKDILSFETSADVKMGFNPDLTAFDKSFYRFKITHIHSNLGLQDGYVVLSLSKLKKDKA